MAEEYEEEYLPLYNNEYYDADEFLAEEQLVPCTFKYFAPNLGPFVAHKDKNIPSDTKVEAPFWLVHALQDEQYVDRGIPKGFVQSVQNGLRACSDNVDINSLNPHFFKLGKKLAHSEGPRGNETDAALAEFLAETYQNRLRLVLDKATTHRHLSAEAYTFLATLDASEKQLYYDCQEAYNAMQEWENGRRPPPTAR